MPQGERSLEWWLISWARFMRLSMQTGTERISVRGFPCSQLTFLRRRNTSSFIVHPCGPSRLYFSQIYWSHDISLISSYPSLQGSAEDWKHIVSTIGEALGANGFIFVKRSPKACNFSLRGWPANTSMVIYWQIYLQNSINAERERNPEFWYSHCSYEHEAFL